MIRSSRATVGAAIGVVMTSALMAGSATPAGAATTCKGSHVGTITLSVPNKPYQGRIGVYRQGTSICAVLVKSGPLYGTPTMISVIIRAQGGTPQVSDTGKYRYQTDAVTLNAARSSNRCVSVGGTVFNKAGTEGKGDRRTFCV